MGVLVGANISQNLSVGHHVGHGMLPGSLNPY